MSAQHPTNPGVPVAEAARILKRHPATVRRMIARGAPCIRPGEVGRNKGALIDMAAFQRWRARDLGALALDDKDLLQRVALALWDTLRRDEAHHRVGISERQAAGVLALVYERIHKNLTHRPLDVLPEEIKRLCAICVE